ncbi:MAG: universal stress protein [Alphaproteobacteria bacterium]|nr:universal stress protein [Alphaproteobacteria bacterium]
MGYKAIIAAINGGPDDKAVLDAAFAAAWPFQGHVTAVFAYPDPRTAVPTMGAPMTPEVVQQVIDAAEMLARKESDRARSAIRAFAAAHNVELDAKPRDPSHVSCSFRTLFGQPAAVLLTESRLSDLVVTSAAAGDAHAVFLELLTKSHRPILLAPEAPVSDLTAHCAIGWDGGAVAAHALRAALPLLKKSQRVTLYTVGATHKSTLEAARDYLRLHGVEAGMRELDAHGTSAGLALLRSAETDGASVIVAGGYGHSRIGETLFGGNTIDLTSYARVPLLLMH